MFLSQPIFKISELLHTHTLQMHMGVLYAYVCTAEYKELSSYLVPTEISFVLLSNYTPMLLILVLNCLVVKYFLSVN